MKYCVCELTSFFDEEFDGSLKKVHRVLQVFDNKADADYALELFHLPRYDDEGLHAEVVAENMLQETFR